MKGEMKNKRMIGEAEGKDEAASLSAKGRRTTKANTIAAVLLVIVVGIIMTTSAVITTTNTLHIQVPLLIQKAYACVQPSQGGGEGDQRCGLLGHPGIPTKICDGCCDISCFPPSLGDGSSDDGECGSSFVINNGGGGPSDQVASVNHRGSQVVNDGNTCDPIPIGGERCTSGRGGTGCDLGDRCVGRCEPVGRHGREVCVIICEDGSFNWWTVPGKGHRTGGHGGHSSGGSIHQVIGPFFNPQTGTDEVKKRGDSTTTASTTDSVKKVREDLTTAIADGNNNKLKNKDTDHHSNSEPQLEVIQPDHKFHHEDSSGTNNHDKGNDGKSKDNGGDKSGKGGDDGSSGSDPDSSVKDVHR